VHTRAQRHLGTGGGQPGGRSWGERGGGGGGPERAPRASHRTWELALPRALPNPPALAHESPHAQLATIQRLAPWAPGCRPTCWHQTRRSHRRRRCAAGGPASAALAPRPARPAAASAPPSRRGSSTGTGGPREAAGRGGGRGCTKIACTRDAAACSGRNAQPSMRTRARAAHLVRRGPRGGQLGQRGQVGALAVAGAGAAARRCSALQAVRRLLPLLHQLGPAGGAARLRTCAAGTGGLQRLPGAVDEAAARHAALSRACPSSRCRHSCPHLAAAPRLLADDAPTV
jgi:hypothetical protein